MKFTFWRLTAAIAAAATLANAVNISDRDANTAFDRADFNFAEITAISGNNEKDPPAEKQLKEEQEEHEAEDEEEQDSNVVRLHTQEELDDYRANHKPKSGNPLDMPPHMKPNMWREKSNDQDVQEPKVPTYRVYESKPYGNNPWIFGGLEQTWPNLDTL